MQNIDFRTRVLNEYRASRAIVTAAVAFGVIAVAGAQPLFAPPTAADAAVVIAGEVPDDHGWD